MYNLPFSAQDVLFLLNYEVPDHMRHTVDIECPMCKGKKKLNFNFDKGFFRCNKCGFAGNPITFYANIMGVSTKEAYHDICDRLKINNRVDEASKIHRTPVVKSEAKECSLADISVRSNTYFELFNELKLSERHMSDLVQRGFSPEFIIDRSYKTFPDVANGESLALTLQQRGCTLEGVPMFYKNGMKWTHIYSKNGICVPYRDFNNQIQGFQVRIDNELIEVDEPKYKWASSRGRNYGTGPNTFIHYACDFAWNVNEKRFMPIITNNTVVITEGAMKGDLFFHLTGQPTLALPGVNCTKSLSDELKKLKSIGVNRIILAYDMDFVLNIHVMKALSKIKKIIKEHGFLFSMLLWDCNILMQDGKTKVNIPLLTKTQDFNVFIYTLKTLKRDLADKTLQKTLSGCKELGVKNLFYAIQEKKDPEELKMWNELKRQAGAFQCTPVMWNLSYKGIDDYYVKKLLG